MWALGLGVWWDGFLYCLEERCYESMEHATSLRTVLSFVVQISSRVPWDLWTYTKLSACVSHSFKVVRYVLLITVFFMDGVTYSCCRAGMHYIVWIDIALHCVSVWCFVYEVREPCVGASHKRHFYSAWTIGWSIARSTEPNVVQFKCKSGQK